MTPPVSRAPVGRRSVQDVRCPLCPRLFRSDAALAQHRLATHDNPLWRPAASDAGKGSAERLAPLCPICNNAALLKDTRYGVRASCCGLHSWDYKPLVAPAVHQARVRAHTLFDFLWKTHLLERDEAYRRLAAAMGLQARLCHISQMDERSARRVVEIVQSGALLADPAP